MKNLENYKLEKLIQKKQSIQKRISEFKNKESAFLLKDIEKKIINIKRKFANLKSD